MKTVELPLAEVAAIAGTRTALGAGVALLLSDRLGQHGRRQIGATLAAIGVLSSFPLVYDILFRRQKSEQPHALN